ncbi:MAG: prephenate/arogenate dehydrogenase family protein [Alphaproteobacteria bacterium]
MSEAVSPSVLFDRVAIIGIGLIGSSLARALRQHALAAHITIADHNPDHVKRACELELGDTATTDAAAAVKDADLVIICTPIGAFEAVAKGIGSALKRGAILTDVGSVKQTAIAAVAPYVPPGVHFIPGHPIAGTEHSGPDAGFAALFVGRYYLYTPLPDTDPAAAEKLAELWRRCGAKVEAMEPEHHDRVLAITSHLPHLIAYTIVGTAADLAGDLQQEVIKYSASGFRDFTRIAASDPTMWRDIFLGNREAVLDIMQRFSEDLTALQKAIRKNDGATLFDLFTRTRAIRRSIIDAKQA